MTGNRPTTGPIVPLPPEPEGGASGRKPRSERWVYAENARYRRALNRVAVELHRIEHTKDITVDEATARIRAIIATAKQEGSNQ